MTRSVAITCALLLLVGTRAVQAAVVPPGFVDAVVDSGFDQPLGMAFIPDGRVLVVEQRSARVRLVVGGHRGTVDPLFTIPSVKSSGEEQGLQGVAVDPGWPARPYVYLIHNRTGGNIRLVRYTVSGDVANPSGSQLIFGSPLLLIDDIPDDNVIHNGGTLRFGPDGYLYASLGEDADRCAAQDSTTLKGEVLRLDVSRLPAGGGGEVPRTLLAPAAPTLASPDSNARLVYSYGFRNPWRFQIDPVTGRLYVGDVGDVTWEEIDEVSGGENFGWPYREGFDLRNYGLCTEPGGTGNGNYATPIAIESHTGGIGAYAVIPAALYRPPGAGTSNWPSEYDGNLFYTDYYSGRLRRMVKSTEWMVAEPVAGQPDPNAWATGIPYPVDFQVGPDGSLWYLCQYNAGSASRSGMLRKIRYDGVQLDVRDGSPRSRRLRIGPNPFTSSTELTFSRAVAENARLVIYDARGRRVRALLGGVIAAGESRVRWDGTDDRGERVGPGVYFARLDSSNGAEAVRVLRLN